jgi:signal transduction histidine kinase
MKELLISLKILVVDDRQENTYSLQSLLSNQEAEIITAGSGAEALNLMMQHDFALAILDIQMPEMNGFELAELMRGVEKTKNIPIIFLTAGTHSSNFEFKGYLMGAVDFLFKPVNPFILQSKVQIFMRLAQKKKMLAAKVLELEHAQREAQQAKKKAEEADRVKSSFLANMSHEIRTPLGALIGFTELLKSNDLTEEERESYLNVILRNGKHLMMLLNEILDLSKVEAGQLEMESQEIAVREFISDILLLFEPVAQKNGVKMEVNFSKNLPCTVMSDALRLRQIVTNIVGNAVKFSPRGKVTLNLDYQFCGSYCELHIFVEDTGIGIDEDKQGLLFKPFKQTDAVITNNFGGTGLGLALSKKLAELLHGDVSLVRSEPQKGSVFKISVRDSKNETLTSPHETKLTSLPSEETEFDRLIEGMKILLVDDSEDNQLLIKTFLERYRASVEVANQGAEAVEMALQASYDVILMDSQMPVCDGLEATRILRSKGYTRPIISLTANAMVEERHRALQSGSNEYLSKPIKWKQLFHTIHRLAAENPKP